jgi:hypothetical protein
MGESTSSTITFHAVNVLQRHRPDLSTTSAHGLLTHHVCLTIIMRFRVCDHLQQVQNPYESCRPYRIPQRPIDLASGFTICYNSYTGQAETQQENYLS